MAERKMRMIRAGELVVITNGAYSDYQMRGVFKALQDFSPDDCRAQYLKAHPKEGEIYHFVEERFVAYLEAAGCVEQIQAIEYHLGDYGDVSAHSVSDIEKVKS